MSETHCGVVTLLGRTNVGKSTLLNALVGAKVSIATDRRQTTRHVVHGVVTEGDRQAIFVDTPGLHKPEDRESKRLLNDARSSLEDVDLVVVVVEPGDRPAGGTQFVLDYLREAGSPPALLVVNKVDTVELGDPAVLKTIQKLSAEYSFVYAYPVSAKDETGLEGLLAAVLARLPQGEHLYPPDEISNVPQTLYAAELVREKAMERTEQEIPHTIEAEVEQLTRDEAGTYHLKVALTVDRESRKGILIGHRGRKIRSIRRAAQADLQSVLEAPVELELTVRVRPKPPKSRGKPRKRKRS